MGIEYTAQILVGAPANNFDEDQVVEWMEDNEIRLRIGSIDSWTGAGKENSITGFPLIDIDLYSPQMVDPSTWSHTIHALKAKFKELTGVDAHTYMCVTIS